MTTHHLDTLRRDGYVLMPGVLGAAALPTIKTAAKHILDAHGSDTMRPSDLLADPDLTSALFSTRVRTTISALFGPSQTLYLYPNFTIRNNLYINWHTDDFFLDAPLEKASALPSLFMFNVYLQGNSLDAGGGLDVQSGTHRLPKSERQARAQADGPAPEHFVASGAGDLIVFDYRVVHRGTIPAGTVRPDRMALQWTMSTSDDVAAVYLAYLQIRASRKLHISDFTRHRAQEFFDDLPHIRAPALIERFSPAFFDSQLRFADMATYLREEPR
ncbi:hypothetical protein UC34_24815 (plasmid) [Pandoraea vervacti]|uniref:Phytanoyl-CoA dioxygenase n=1 Tax=Pandoraea vervacti TaxID=656178 RepID=A0ABM5T5A0_9BURK|nr:hypothetical protein [Pandoraea vervacti]AJP60140.1 hypothetical protein UC34_24815 [Pandoraea vervacti]